MIISADTYNIHIGDLDFDKGSKSIVIVDENTRKYCLPIFDDAFCGTYDVIEIPAGEEYKNLDTAQFIWSKMLKIGCDRHTTCYNLGGGVIGDMGGFSASTFMRGMTFVQIPTTLLSMVDASVGGKLGINFKGLKNNIGLIQNPNAVFIDTRFLNTLPQRELLSGYAEVIKHCLIKDKSAFGNLPKTLENLNFDEFIAHSVKIKKSITDNDPLEKGYRKVLNFGHTIGHAIESSLLHSDKKLLHGEAIAIGMICEAHISMQKGFLTMEEVDIIADFILAIYGNHQDILPSDVAIFALSKKDKKNENGIIQCSLLESIGNGIFNQEISQNEISLALEYYSEKG